MLLETVSGLPHDNCTVEESDSPAKKVGRLYSKLGTDQEI